MLRQPISKCRGCQAPIQWVKTAAGKNTPVNLDGSPHWASCPKVQDFKRKQQEKPAEPTLFD